MNLDIFKSLMTFDKDIIVYVQKNLSSSFWDSFFYWITDLHKESFFIILVIIPLSIFWIGKEKKRGLLRLLGLIFLLAVNDFICGSIIKKIFSQPRPFILFPEIIQKSPASGYSFISNHSANTAALAFYLGYYYPKTKLIWYLLAILISFSRIYNGVHFVSDVLVGSSIGFLISWIWIRKTEHYLKRWE